MSRDNSKTAVAHRRELHLLNLQQAADRIVMELRQRTDVQKIILFGSFATGTAGSRSDLDLLVVQETKTVFLDRADDLTRNLRPGVALDLLVYTPEEWESLKLTRSFVAQIAREGRVLYERIAA